MRLPDLLPPVLLPAAELGALRLDGEVYHVGSSWRPVDLPETAEARADALAVELGTAVVADRATAAWLHGARASPPTPLTACVPISARVAVGKRPGVEVRELRLRDFELVRMGVLRVTDAARTAVDLLRRDEWDRHARETVSVLLAQCGADEVRERLGDRRFAAFRSRTLARLEELGAE